MTEETRITNEKTGGQKGSKDQRMELLPYTVLLKISEIYNMGAEKYDKHNWRKGYDWDLSFGALQRHLALWWEGEELDEESGLSHLAHAAFHIFALIEFESYPDKYEELDNRFDHG